MDTSWKAGNGRTIGELMAMNRVKVGTVIEILIDRKVVHYLIGDINADLGVCDDCSIPATTVVRRYRAIPYKG